MITFPKQCHVIKNKYFYIYQRLMDSRKLQIKDGTVYVEKHHIIPRCIAPLSNETVFLTAREHFLAHKILIKFISNQVYRKKLVYALWGLCNQRNNGRKLLRINSRHYASAKTEYISSISGENHWMKRPELRKKLSETRKRMGIKPSAESRRKTSERLKGVPFSEEHKIKIGNANRGKKRTNDMNRAQSEMMKLRAACGSWVNPTKGIVRERFLCPVCGKQADAANFKRWHGENCTKSRHQKRIKVREIKAICVHCGKTSSLGMIQLYHNENCHLINNQPKRQCPHCSKMIGQRRFNRWHGKNCKFNPNGKSLPVVVSN